MGAGAGGLAAVGFAPAPLTAGGLAPGAPGFCPAGELLGAVGFVVPGAAGFGVVGAAGFCPADGGFAPPGGVLPLGAGAPGLPAAGFAPVAGFGPGVPGAGCFFGSFGVGALDMGVICESCLASRAP